MTRAGSFTSASSSGAAAVPDFVAPGHAVERALQRLAVEERLVALDVDDDVEVPVLGARGDLGHPFGAGGVPLVGQHGVDARPLHDLHHHRRVGGDDQLVHQVVGGHAVDHPGHQGLTGQELKRFVEESGRPEAGRDDTEDAHPKI